MKALVINQEDLEHNIRTIKELVNEPEEQDNHRPTEIISVVKGNGYGLDLIQYSKLLIDNGINILAVSTVEEAIALREAKIEAQILMLSSTAVKEEVEKLIDNDIIISLGSKEAVVVAEKIGEEKAIKIKAHLKIDTGFGRYGFIYTEENDIVSTLKATKNIEILGTFSHFSLAFYNKNKYTETQFKRFMNVVEVLKENNIKTGMLHICNSSAFLKFKYMRLDAVRVGSAFLGRLAIPNTYGLKKIGYLKSKITEIKTLPKGYNIGYSNSYITKKETKVAIIPCGYADGYNVREQRDMFRKRDKLRYIVRDVKDSFKKQFLYVEVVTKNGLRKKCKVLGRIGMYHITIDITGTDLQIDDEVILNVSPFLVDSNIRRIYEKNC